VSSIFSARRGLLISSKSYKSSVDTFSALDSQVQYGPTFELEYSTRETYGGNIPWAANDPLNATWWQHVTEGEFSRMLMLYSC
jgi:sphingomyelin phosphodiesterase